MIEHISQSKADYVIQKYLIHQTYRLREQMISINRLGAKIMREISNDDVVLSVQISDTSCLTHRISKVRLLR